MDFFAHQERARKQTTVLVVYFVAAVAGIIAAVYLASVLIFYFTQPGRPGAPPLELSFWDPQLLVYAVLGTLAVVLVGSLYKTAVLRRGGSAVAETLGGRLVDAGTRDPDERKLMNVVEEMAIASGLPVPKVYVLDHEPGINAFAAGHAPDNAAVAITRGGLSVLDRDELQAVIGHEFSHIHNGDMRLNLRIMGVLFGILCLAIIGRVLLYSRGGGRGRNPMMFLGLALIVIGAIGIFFGRLIQAGLSRQRELLADASAVQFTRNPAALSSALQKIGAVGSQLGSAHAGEASHMYFENGIGKPMFALMATHPPLEQRIRAIDPGWDGQFKPVTVPGAELSRGSSVPSG